MCCVVLVEVGLGYGEVGAVSVRSHCEDEGLPCEDGQVTHQLPGVGDKKQALLLTIYHTLIDMEKPRDDKRHTHILSRRKRKTLHDIS